MSPPKMRVMHKYGCGQVAMFLKRKIAPGNWIDMEDICGQNGEKPLSYTTCFSCGIKLTRADVQEPTRALEVIE